ncbi:MAG: DUF111 family protein [Desulfobacteraceae bacterium]
MVRVLCTPDKRTAVVDRILAETTTIGVRFYEVQRSCLKRRAVEVETPWGRMKAKSVSDVDGGERIIPEYEACKEAARTHGIALRTVYEAVTNAAK